MVWAGVNLVSMPSRLPAVVGSARNARMSVATASSTATFAADEVIVATALGGVHWCLANFSQAINLGSTGAGGLDVSGGVYSGYVAIYAIYNPTTGATALLATNATASVAPNVYGGAAMPSGYTASALVSVWPTNSSGLLVSGSQLDRSLSFVLTNALSASATYSAYTSLSIAGIVPPNAKSCAGSVAVQSTASSNLTLNLSQFSNGIGAFEAFGTSTPGGAQSVAPFPCRSGSDKRFITITEAQAARRFS
jgi:hypothetical protein